MGMRAEDELFVVPWSFSSPKPDLISDHPVSPRRHHVYGPPGGDAEAGRWQSHDDEGWQVGGTEVY